METITFSTFASWVLGGDTQMIEVRDLRV